MDSSHSATTSNVKIINIVDDATSGLPYVTDTSGNHWFKVRDIGTLLNYAPTGISITVQQLVRNESPEAVKKFSELSLSDAEKKLHKISKGKKMINERGIAQWLMSTRMPTAKQFKKWLTENAIIYDETPLVKKYLTSSVVLENIEEDKHVFNTGYVFIATSADYASRDYYIIRRSKKLTKRFNELNSVMLEPRMKLKPCLIWKSFRYKSDKLQLKSEFKGCREQTFFRLDKKQLDHAKKRMAQWGALIMTMEDVRREEREERDKLAAAEASLIADDSILDESREIVSQPQEPTHPTADEAPAANDEPMEEAHVPNTFSTESNDTDNEDSDSDWITDSDSDQEEDLAVTMSNIEL
ncbi:hypothetical protein TSAR_007867 [Trichomalopsis sarcophagae]|uniref:Bro-N domain-containing protein n=1 Tax=Trichomalopsis sarcophagae TaxID=543379 RepID=A0A232FFZ8_9HYME|nr:hypothetical protein TSAR_007867 [Trichomalopsis sarcophagae]